MCAEGTNKLTYSIIPFKSVGEIPGGPQEGAANFLLKYLKLLIRRSPIRNLSRIRHANHPSQATPRNN